MAISVLIVDDSRFFRDRIAEIFKSTPEFNVVGMAEDGVEAVEKALKLKPDVITMDYEMPRLDGISAVRQILAKQKVPILMFSSLTYEGARVTLDALAAGALDFLPKNFEIVRAGSTDSNKILTDKVKALACSSYAAYANGASTPSTRHSNQNDSSSHRQTPSLQVASQYASHKTSQNRAINTPQRSQTTLNNSGLSSTPKTADHRQTRSKKSIKLLAIGASTGGPVALQTVLEKIPNNFPVPIVLIQHMPGSFTKAFADRLNNYCQIRVKEAAQGDKLRPGLALLAPGGSQMMISNGVVKLVLGDDRLKYRPSVDVTFGSVSKIFPGEVLAIVLTGMGFDGREGAKLLKRGGSTIWTQDERSSVIYGMPAAVKNAGLSDQEYSINHIGQRIVEEVMGGSS